MVLELGSKKFDETIKEGVTVVDFWAPWCGPCRMIHPIIDELAEEMPNVKFAKLDIDKDQQLAMQYSVMSIPTIIIFKDGSPQDTIIGVTPKGKIKEKIEKVIG